MKAMSRTQLIVHSLSIVLPIGIFVLDARTPLGMELWLFYLVPLVLVALWLKPIALYLFGAVITVLIVLGQFASPQSGIVQELAVINRCVGIAVIWVVTLIFAECGRLVERLRTQEQQLESQVKVRTDELNRALTKYATIFEAVPVGISITDDAGRILESNREADQMLGISHENHLERSLASPEWRIMRPDGTPMPVAEFAAERAQREQRRVENVEMAVVRPDGATHWISVTAVPIGVDGYGVAVGYVDITERKRAEDAIRQSEDALRRSEQKYRMLADNTNDVIWARDTQGKLIYTSPSYAQLGILPIEELATMSALDAVTAHELAAGGDRIKRLVAAAAEGESIAPEKYEMNRLRRDGSHLALEVMLSPMYGDDGALSGFVCVGRDIGERRQLEAALRKSEEKFSKAFRTSPAGIVISTRDEGRIIDANAAYAKMTGYSLDELIGHSSTELGIFEAIYRKKLLDAFVRDGFAHEMDARIVTKLGKVVDVLMSLEQLELEDTPCILGISMDISERKQMERTLRDMNIELEQRVVARTAELASALDEVQQASRMKDEFMAAVSHELRTPLTGILGITEALQTQIVGPLTERQAHYLAGVHESGNRLLTLVSSILRYTALQGGMVDLQLERCGLKEVGSIALRSVHSRADAKGLQATFTIDSPERAIGGDNDAIIQVLQQLLDNAVKFTPAGGRIGLDIHGDERGDCVQLVVWDTGIGVKPEQCEAIFRPFVQGDATLARRYEGLGLGLAYVQQMVKLMGGAITIESQIGAGSRFIVTLPSMLPPGGQNPAHP